VQPSDQVQPTSVLHLVSVKNPEHDDTVPEHVADAGSHEHPCWMQPSCAAKPLQGAGTPLQAIWIWHPGQLEQPRLASHSAQVAYVGVPLHPARFA
jgi:hypothetical protein